MRAAFFVLPVLVLVACGKKKPDPVQEVRAFMADWERAIDSRNPTALESLLTTVEHSVPIDTRRFLAEIYNSNSVKGVNVVGRKLDIGEKKATVSGRLVRSGLADSLATLTLTLLKTGKGWRWAAYHWEPFKPVKEDSASAGTTIL